MFSSMVLLRYAFMSAFGVFIHHGLFKKDEWHMEGCNVLLYGLISVPLLILLSWTQEETATNVVVDAAFLIISFIISLFLSMAIYRVFWHRTRHFRGPRLAGVSKFWHMLCCLGGQNHLVLERLHERYGDFVRTGPNEITIFHPEVLARLDGPGSKTQKSPWYDLLLPHVGITTIRDQAQHDQRRRIWNRGFTTAEMARYLEHIVDNGKTLDKIVGDASGQKLSVNFSTYAYWFSFDVMGLFAFSRSFDMLRREEWHYRVVTLRRAMRLLGPFSPVPWLARIGFSLMKNYWVVKDWHTMISWCATCMNERIQEPDSHDVAQFIIEDSKKRNALDTDEPLLIGDAIVAIIAGSDTVAPTLVFIFYRLALNPERADKLCEELCGIDVYDTSALRKLPYLNSVIKETLRLHPAVPTGGYRDTPPEGMVIGGKLIPGRTTIVAPRYVSGRLESCFQQAKYWIPERWDTKPELTKDARSYLPFAQERYTCLGKDLAMSEMLIVTALLVSRYRIQFPPSYSARDIQRVETEMRDQFTATPGDLNLRFFRRGE